jgi:DNA-binding MarR family transcriptional regulator
MTGKHEQAARTWVGMRSLVLELHDRRKEVCDELDMSFIKVKALRRIADGPLSMRELAAKLGTDAPYATLIVHDLEERGLVVRSPHPNDRRSKIATPTEAGQRTAERAGRILDEPPAVLRDLPERDLADLDRVIAALLTGSEPML